MPRKSDRRSWQNCKFFVAPACVWKDRKKKINYTVLLALMLKVQLGFLRQLGIFYATQPSIGIDMYSQDQHRMVSYRQFCEFLMDPTKRVWFDRLIAYYLETGRGEKLDRVEEAISAMQALTEFLDRTVGGGTSIQRRFEAEGIRSL